MRGPPDDPRFHPAWRRAGELGVPVLIHTGEPNPFIAAHLAWMGNDLARLGRLFDEHPNVYTGVAAVIAELGRQPRFAREWFIRYQDRVLFGKDVWAPMEYHTYFRVLETADEYFDYFRKRHAFRQMYGLDLPDPVLRSSISRTPCG